MVQIPNAFRVIAYFKAYPFHAVSSELTFLLYCDLVFVQLYAMQWFVSARVDSFASMQND